MLRDEETNGQILLIGGGLRITPFSPVLSLFLDISGNGDAKIVIIPSAMKGSGRRLKDTLLSMGAKEVIILDAYTRQDCERVEIVETLKAASGVFIGGGDPTCLAKTVMGTSVSDIIQELHYQGVAIAGSSCGASFLCQKMFEKGISGLSTHFKNTTFLEGLSLLRDIVVDTHFTQRERLGRLLNGLSQADVQLAIGIDEDTSIFIDHDGSMAVLGTGSTTFLSKSKSRYKADFDNSTGELSAIQGVSLAVLSDGSKYCARKC